MNIAIVRHTIKNRGADRIIFDHADYLISQGHTVSYYTGLRESSFESHPKIEYRPIPYKGAIGTLVFMATYRFTEDVVIVDLIVMAVAGRLGLNRNIIYFAQDYDVTYYSSKLLRGFTHFLYRLGLKSYRIPTITVSEALAENLRKYNPGHPQIVTANNGIDLRRFSPKLQSPYADQKKGKGVIIFYARSDYRKGMDIAQLALKKLGQICDLKNWEVWVIGEEFPDVEGVVVRNFRFLDEDSLAEILTAADIYFMSSRSEGLSTLLLQAIACGCAVVATEAANIIAHEKDGLIAPLEDAEGLAAQLKRLIEDAGRLKHYRARALQLAQNYSIENCRKNFAAALQKLAEFT